MSQVSSARHPIPIEDWPSAEEAAGSRLFSPLRLASGLRLEARTWVPAMVPWRATREGYVTPAVLAWYRRFASGRPGTLVVEATGIRDVPSGPLLRIGDDRFVPGLVELVETVARASEGRTRLLIQILDFLAIRRRPERARFLEEFLVLRAQHRERLASLRPGLDVTDDRAVRGALIGCDEREIEQVLDERELHALAFGARERVTDVHLPHIARLPQVLPGLFADAAARARRAGFDGVELHYAHAYSMASFLSRRNDRSDGYGGPLEQRLRLPLDVLAAARARVGRDYTLGVRFLAEEGIVGGNELADAVVIGERLAAAGADFLSLSRGGKFEDARQPRPGEAAYPYTGPSGRLCMPSVYDEQPPFGAALAHAAAVRAGVRAAGHTTPVVATGGINGFRLAEHALASGMADLIGAARQSLADPDWFAKVRAGRGASVVRCEYTNYCEALDQHHKEVTCKLWDRLFTPGDGAALSADGRRRLVAPPAGWSPARRSTTA
jgi:2,4-dienoyl-CoA reductase-like NADH-dependent reductase (Old Yellow Enzyme family)